ncbi:MAG: U32 family peptidase [Rikenellaceae bacterium]|nr:U32 family peptidase [Rikenellaceae bacterium]MDE7356224.1 U32 family peptidase [Rikenellaceae bacterium]
MERKDIEIMAPVGSYESLHAAIKGGCDAVYFGVGQLNMRSSSSFNFTIDDLHNIVATCKEHGIKSYLTVNCIFYDQDLADMRAIIDAAATAGVTAVIASDQAAIMYARAKNVEVHISTQLNVSNIETLRFYAAYADVVVLARELNLEQVKNIHEAIVREHITGPKGELIKIEMFVHGALCMAVSGKCYLSLHEADKSANRGSCRQICRRSYRVTDMETGYELEVDNKYIMSPKDLCTIEFIDKMIESGVSVFKIEGRARPGEYVKRVVECYSAAVKAYSEGLYTPEYAQELKERLSTVFNRGFWEGYYLGKTMGQWSRHYGSSAVKKRQYVGKITNFFKNISVAEIAVEAAPLSVGEELIITGNTTGVIEMFAPEIRVDLNAVQTAPQGIRCSFVTPEPVHRGDKVYKLVDNILE